MIAALYVETNGAYFNLRGVDPWDEIRDARNYDGPWPVVAHPPCQRWGPMWMGSPLQVARTGVRKTKGDDGGCFEHALNVCRKYGGVIEHPWRSHAWKHFGLKVPSRKGGWVRADDLGGWTCCVEQGAYGHWMRKPTLLYVVDCDLPDLIFGETEAKYPQWALERYGLARCKRMGEIAFKGGGGNAASREFTPTSFRDILIHTALSTYRRLLR